MWKERLLHLRGDHFYICFPARRSIKAPLKRATGLVVAISNQSAQRIASEPLTMHSLLGIALILHYKVEGNRYMAGVRLG